jgi:hypothetical protein
MDLGWANGRTGSRVFGEPKRPARRFGVTSWEWDCVDLHKGPTGQVLDLPLMGLLLSKGSTMDGFVLMLVCKVLTAHQRGQGGMPTMAHQRGNVGLINELTDLKSQ